MNLWEVLGMAALGLAAWIGLLTWRERRRLIRQHRAATPPTSSPPSPAHSASPARSRERIDPTLGPVSQGQDTAVPPLHRLPQIHPSDLPDDGLYAIVHLPAGAVPVPVGPLRRIGTRPLRWLRPQEHSGDEDSPDGGLTLLLPLYCRSSGGLQAGDPEAIEAFLDAHPGSQIRLPNESDPLALEDLLPLGRRAAELVEAADLQLMLQIDAGLEGSEALFNTVLLAQGFVGLTPGRYGARLVDGQPELMATLGPEPGLIRLSLDLPLVTQPDEAAQDLVALAQQLALAIQGQIQDASSRPLSDRQLEQIPYGVAQRVLQLQALGLQPGGPAARWIFS